MYKYDKNIENTLLKISLTPDKTCWEKLVESDSKLEILFPSTIYKDPSRKNGMSPFNAKR